MISQKTRCLNTLLLHVRCTGLVTHIIATFQMLLSPLLEHCRDRLVAVYALDRFSEDVSD